MTADPLDTDYILAWSLERQQAAWNHEHAINGGPRCPKCNHREHGLICSFLGRTSCDCPSSFWESKP